MRQQAVDYFRTYSKQNIKVLADEKTLNGSRRVLASGFLSPKQCWELSRVTQLASTEGDGYSQRKNPHTSSEHFAGVTLSRAALMVQAGYLKLETLHLILSVSNFSKVFLERYFELKKPLYFSFTHLVCRSSKEDVSNRSLSDLSHAIHVDNCILQSDGSCLKVPPAYTFRDYSAILYLNDEFEGGEFIFSADPSGIAYQSKITPHCGHLVGFSAGQENPHGVRPVTRGTRCAMAMWFTFQKKHREAERELAEIFLQRMMKGNATTPPVSYSP